MSKEAKYIITEQKLADIIYEIYQISLDSSEDNIVRSAALVLKDLKELKPVQEGKLGDLSPADLCGLHQFYIYLNPPPLNEAHKQMVDIQKEIISRINLLNPDFGI